MVYLLCANMLASCHKRRSPTRRASCGESGRTTRLVLVRWCCSARLTAGSRDGTIPARGCARRTVPETLRRALAARCARVRHDDRDLSVTILLVLNYGRDRQPRLDLQLHDLLSTLATLIPFVFCSLAPALLPRNGIEMPPTRLRDRVVMTIAFTYSVWAIYGAGRKRCSWNLAHADGNPRLRVAEATRRGSVGADVIVPLLLMLQRETCNIALNSRCRNRGQESITSAAKSRSVRALRTESRQRLAHDPVAQLDVGDADGGSSLRDQARRRHSGQRVGFKQVVAALRVESKIEACVDRESEAPRTRASTSAIRRARRRRRRAGTMYSELPAWYLC